MYRIPNIMSNVMLWTHLTSYSKNFSSILRFEILYSPMLMALMHSVNTCNLENLLTKMYLMNLKIHSTRECSSLFLKRVLKRPLSLLINNCIKFRKLPTMWKLSKSRPVYKKNIGDIYYLIIDTFLSYAMSVFEMLLKNKISISSI